MTFSLLAVGDLLVDDSDLAVLLAPAARMLASGDITFGNCESPYGARDTGTIAAFRHVAGFDVMSFANNHILDRGQRAFFSTLELLQQHGIAAVGAGTDIAEARRPAVLARDGARVAFLAYSSIGVPSSAAGIDRPGCAPLKVHTGYEDLFDAEYPGGPARIITTASRADLDALCADVRAARDVADMVIVSLHWGPLLMRGELSDYQPIVARAAIDSGADAILGHHPHTLKGIDVYHGRPIFYSLGHFVMRTAPGAGGGAADRATQRRDHVNGPVDDSLVGKMRKAYRGEFGYFPEHPRYPFGPDTRFTMVAEITITDASVARVAYHPYLIDNDDIPIPLAADDDRFERHLAYMREANEEGGLAAALRPDGDVVVVDAA